MYDTECRRQFPFASSLSNGAEGTSSSDQSFSPAHCSQDGLENTSIIPIIDSEHKNGNTMSVVDDSLSSTDLVISNAELEALHHVSSTQGNHTASYNAVEARKVAVEDHWSCAFIDSTDDFY